MVMVLNLVKNESAIAAPTSGKLEDGGCRWGVKIHGGDKTRHERRQR